LAQEIEALGVEFKKLEIELFKLRCRIEARQWPPRSQDSGRDGGSVRIALSSSSVIKRTNRCSMTRLILASLQLAISILPLCAQSTSLHTDRSGYTTGTDGNLTVNTYTDRYGNTTGWIGGKYISYL
jgi:hypothetical protein